jgi:eukaryotic-like serine/threonine-protein kinase
MILGTAGYMSPEQARGKPVDKRADIWAFGVVLFEMLTGQRLFEGETVSDTLAAVLKEEPDWTRVPVKVRRLLQACLQKDPKQRLQATGDWRLMLADDAPVTTAPSRSRLVWVLATFAAVVTLALAALSFVHFREQPPFAEVSRFQLVLPANVTLPAGFANQRVAPDGRKLAFAAASADGKLRLWIRSFDSLDARPLPGIELANVYAPFFWSYDSRFIAFLSSDHELKKVDVSGGPAQGICDAVYLVGGSWNRDGVILFAEGSRSGVKRVSQAGGTPITLTALDPARQERGHLSPQMLPDGRHFLYYRDSTTPGNSGIYVGSIDAKPSEQGSKPLLVNDGLFALYAPSGSSNPADSSKGYLLFARDGTALAQPFDPDKLELSGDPVPVDEQMGNFSAPAAFLSVSTNGVLAYMRGNTLNAQLTWFDREGKNQGTVGDPEFFNTLALSRDGKQVAASRIDFGPVRNATLWLYDVARGGSPTRFTFGTFTHDYAVFSPDGSRIVFRSLRDGPGNLYQKLASGAKDEEPLLKSDADKIPYSWSRDGNFLLYVVRTPKTKDDIWILPMDGSKKPPMLFQATEFNETAPLFSPDGHWIAYDSDTSGRNEVYVREFSLGSDGKPEATAPHLISDGGGRLGHWRDDGKELSYLSPDGKTIMAAEISSKPVFQASPAKALFQIPGSADAAGLFDALVATADGKRFLVGVPFRQSGPQQITVVLNWQAGLKK